MTGDLQFPCASGASGSSECVRSDGRDIWPSVRPVRGAYRSTPGRTPDRAQTSDNRVGVNLVSTFVQPGDRAFDLREVE